MSTTVLSPHIVYLPPLIMGEMGYCRPKYIPCVVVAAAAAIIFNLCITFHKSLKHTIKAIKIVLKAKQKTPKVGLKPIDNEHLRLKSFHPAGKACCNKNVFGKYKYWPPAESHQGYFPTKQGQPQTESPASRYVMLRGLLIF